ncbi:MAG TPA: protein-glutamate O-methyltransferase CheR [Bacteroidia bacterium]|nr:protein-glutamate O-methyltransferase CheR [Bacteroidia bacterium]
MLSTKQEAVILQEAAINRFLLELRKEFSVDYLGYSRTFISRRLSGFLQKVELGNLELLLALFRQREEYLTLLQSEMSINYTEMFRNPKFFESLRKSVFPFLATYPTLNIWHAGCSSGEEVYSMAILLDEVGLLKRTKIIATDKDDKVLEKAESATFDGARLKEYTANYYNAGGRKEFSNYYSASYGQFKIREDVRKSISFMQHNLDTDKPFQKFNLILCRNVMIYFSPEMQDKVVGNMCAGLSNLGYLGLGSTETLSFNKYRHEFASINKSEKIYRKVSLSEWKNCKN